MEKKKYENDFTINECNHISHQVLLLSSLNKKSIPFCLKSPTNISSFSQNTKTSPRSLEDLRNAKSYGPTKQCMFLLPTVKNHSQTWVILMTENGDRMILILTSREKFKFAQIQAFINSNSNPK